MQLMFYKCPAWLLLLLNGSYRLFFTMPSYSSLKKLIDKGLGRKLCYFSIYC